MGRELIVCSILQIRRASPDGFHSSGSIASNSTPSLSTRPDEDSPSVDIFPRQESSIPPLKHYRLVRLGAYGSPADAPVKEPVLWVTEVVELDSSDAVSSNPSTADRGVGLSLGSASNFGRKDGGYKEACGLGITFLRDMPRKTLNLLRLLRIKRRM